MAKQLLVYVMSVGMLMATPSIVAAQPQEPGAQMTLVGTVEAVDHKARTVTIRGSGGVAVTVDVPPDCRTVRTDQGWRRRDGHLLRSHQPAVEARGRAGRRPDVGTDDCGDTRGSAGCHENQAAGDHRDHHRLGPGQQGGDLHRTERDGLLAPTAGLHRPQDRRGSQAGRSRGRHQDRSGDARRAAREPPSPCGTASRSRSSSGWTTSSAAR